MGTFCFYLGIKLGICGYPSTHQRSYSSDIITSLLNLDLERTATPV